MIKPESLLVSSPESRLKELQADRQLKYGVTKAVPRSTHFVQERQVYRTGSHGRLPPRSSICPPTLPLSTMISESMVCLSFYQCVFST